MTGMILRFLKTLVVLTSLLAPLTLAASSAAADPMPDYEFLPDPSAIMAEAGLQRVSRAITVPATVASMSGWLLLQLGALGRQARAGRVRAEMRQPGVHFAVMLAWSGQATILLGIYNLSDALSAAALTVMAAAIAGCLWRVVQLRSTPEDPESSLWGMTRSTTSQMTGRARRRQA